ncbi:MAG TPA: lipocalin-like domain-containing protein [Steroidobacteraceae bacterium]
MSVARRNLAAWLAFGLVLVPLAAQAAPSPLEVLRSGASDQGFERAESVPTFEFPRDHGPHASFRHEWWYFTGHLRAKDGERFGFEVTFFRVALAPPRAETLKPAAGEPVSQWRARQIYVAHFAVTDIGRGTFHSTQRLARDALGLSGAQATPPRVWLGGWSAAAQSAHPDTSSDASDWILRAGDCAYRLDLKLHPLQPPVPNGDRGLSVKSSEPGNASYYFSVPRLSIEGDIVRGVCGAGGAQAAGAARPLEVSGTAWLDREWGSGSLGARESGWDWFALQLADGSALMFYALRDEGGVRDSHSAGTWIEPDGRAQALASRDVSIEVLDHWRSPNGARYPSRWRVRVASLGLDVMAVPVLADQELETTPRYWEGDVDVGGTRDGKAISGEGYVELVGYAGR